MARAVYCTGSEEPTAGEHSASLLILPVASSQAAGWIVKIVIFSAERPIVHALFWP